MRSFSIHPRFSRLNLSKSSTIVAVELVTENSRFEDVKLRKRFFPGL
jgi:hypothetical protein